MKSELFQHDPKKPILFTDLETTGTGSAHEIIEIGAVLTTPDLKIINEINLKVRAEHIETAQQRALDVNGYSEEAWRDAISLEEAIALYNEQAKDATFIAYNAPFDWRFLKNAFNATGIESQLSGRVICNLAFAKYALEGAGLESFTQEAVAIHLELEPEPAVHRAANGARLTREVYDALSRL